LRLVYVRDWRPHGSGDSGVIDREIQTPEPGDGLLHHRLYVSALAYIRAYEETLGADSLDLPKHDLALIGSTRSNRDPRALARKP
jgi:hypothetical protein